MTRKRNAPLLLIENSQGGLNNICSAAGIRQCQPKAASRTTASRAREESVPFRTHNSVLRMNPTEKDISCYHAQNLVYPEETAIEDGVH